MCLQVLCEEEERPKRTPSFGYKWMLKCRNRRGCDGNECYTTPYQYTHFEKGEFRWRHRNEWLFANALRRSIWDRIKVGKQKYCQDTYPAGYHLFTSKKDAEKWRDKVLERNYFRFLWEDRFYLTLCKFEVEPKHVMAWGFEYDVKVFVAQGIKFVGPV